MKRIALLLAFLIILPLSAMTEERGVEYSVQAGVFTDMNAALALRDKLEEATGFEPYYIEPKPGVYEVRFGEFVTRSFARAEAFKLVEQGVLNDSYEIVESEFLIIYPEVEEHPGGSENKFDEAPRVGAAPAAPVSLREQLVKTALSYIGVPYLWGGMTRSGVDCSGLMVASFKTNGLSLARRSAHQFEQGKPVHEDNLQKGDLVFFDTSRKNRVSHVGMYVGDGKFIHAPSSGKTVRTDSLNNPFWSKVYMGAKTFL